MSQKEITIVLFETTWRSLISLIISWVTRTPFSHAGFCIDGQYYDASENRGNFDRVCTHGELLSGVKGKRRLHCYHITLTEAEHKALQKFVRLNRYQRYDWVGVFGWLWNANDKKRWYCFEAVWAALHAIGKVEEQKGALSGEDLRQWCLKQVPHGYRLVD